MQQWPISDGFNKGFDVENVDFHPFRWPLKMIRICLKN